MGMQPLKGRFVLLKEELIFVLSGMFSIMLF